MPDNQQLLQEKVRQAYGKQLPLNIRGSGSKDFYGYPNSGEALSLAGHTGILNYEPAELVLTARAGTPLKEIEKTLAGHNQMLACEAPHFGEHATFGGMIAAGLSGPGRPFGGSVADLILGCKLLNGKGEVLSFGGKVMKNVAGYDTSRLMVGSLGCLAVILEATVKVLPWPGAERSFRFDIDRGKVTPFINKLTGMGFPVSASSHDNQNLMVRFSAGQREVSGLDSSIRQQFAFIDFDEDVPAGYWQDLREQRTEFFSADTNLWRLSLPPDTKLDLPGNSLVEWHGALRWIKTEEPAEKIFSETARVNGSATLFRTKTPQEAGSIFQPLPQALMKWHVQLKKAFDPAGIFNPGRMYRDL